MPDRPPSDLKRVTAQYHAAVQGLTDNALADLQGRWQGVQATLDLKIKRLTDQIAAAQAKGETVNVAWLTQAQRLEQLRQAVQGDVSAFADGAADIVQQSMSSAADLGQAAAQAALAATVPPGVNYTFGVPPSDVTETLAGALQPGSPLNALFGQMGSTVAAFAQQALFTGVALGEGPRQIARRLQWATNMAPRRAEVIARTETLRSWRHAQFANYQANRDVVQQWMWAADFGPRCCFPAGTLVQTRRGLIAIEQVRVGDEALTHQGRYRRVVDTMSRSYSGEMVTITAGSRKVIATSDHPFLVERQGQLNWVEAGAITLTDCVVGQFKGGAKISNHLFRDIAIEGRVGQPNDPIPPALEHDRLAGVRLSAVVDALMPIDAINFQHGIEAGKIEIHRIAPTRDGVFLQVFNAQRFQAKTRSGFRLRFPCMGTIAAHRAVAVHLGRLRIKWLAACLAGHLGARRHAAFIRAMFGVNPANAKHLAANRTRLKGRAAVFARYRAETCASPRDHRWTRLKMLATRLASTFNGLLAHEYANVSVPAFTTTVHPRRVTVRVLGQRHLATASASTLNLLHSLTSSSSIFSSMIPQKLAIGKELVTVFNLTVEQDQSYVANGFVVHNCGACIAMDGTFHDLSEELDDHICGRCSAIPITRSWADILADGGMSQDEIDALGLTETSGMAWAQSRESGESWLQRQSTEVQNQILGPAKAEAWRQGAFPLERVVGVVHDPQWGSSIRELSLRQMGINAQTWLQAAREAGNGSVLADANALQAAHAETSLTMAAEQRVAQNAEAKAAADEWYQQIQRSIASGQAGGLTSAEAKAAADEWFASVKDQLRPGGLSVEDVARAMEQRLGLAANPAVEAEVAAETAATTVTYTADDAAERLMMAFPHLDAPLTDEQVANLAGAPPGSTVTVSRHREITVTPPDGRYTSSVYVVPGAEGPLLLNWQFIAPDSSNDIAVDPEALAAQVRQANALGIDSIHMKARIGSADYAELPQLGYDAPIQQVLTEARDHTLPAGLEGAQSLSEVLSTPEGRVWWAENGLNPGFDFDPRPSSQSYQVLDAYLREHGLPGLEVAPEVAPATVETTMAAAEAASTLTPEQIAAFEARDLTPMEGETGIVNEADMAPDARANVDTETLRIVQAIHPEDMSAGAAKEQVAKALGQALADNPEFAKIADAMADFWRRDLIEQGYSEAAADAGVAAMARDPEQIASALIKSWADGQGTLPPALQQAIRDEFNLIAAARLPNSALVKQARAEWAEVQPGLRAFVREMYNQTQQWFADNGITDVPLYRGMGWKKLPKWMDASLLDGQPHELTVPLRAASSFSVDSATALNFAQSPVSDAEDILYEQVIALHVPAAAILATPQTGFGALNEYEAVVLGGRYTAIGIGVDNSAGAGDTVTVDEILANYHELTYEQIANLLAKSEPQEPQP